MGRIVILMRHAQAAMPEPGMKDFDRPLTAHGASEAVSAAKLLLVSGHMPELIIASSSRRTIETVNHVKTVIGDSIPIETDMSLYSGDARFYLDAILSATAACIMIVGHNPMTEQVVLELAAVSGQTPRELRVGFATASIAIFEIEVENNTVKHSKLLGQITL
jgi:phosphohistidine phosphatase